MSNRRRAKSFARAVSPKMASVTFSRATPSACSDLLSKRAVDVVGDDCALYCRAFVNDRAVAAVTEVAGSGRHPVHFDFTAIRRVEGRAEALRILRGVDSEAGLRPVSDALRHVAAHAVG